MEFASPQYLHNTISDRTVKHSRHFPFSRETPNNPRRKFHHNFSLLQVYALLCVISQYQEYQAGRGTAGPYDPCKVRSTWQLFQACRLKYTMPKYLKTAIWRYTPWIWANRFLSQSYHKASIMCLSARIPATYHETTNSPPGNHSARLQSGILAEEFPSPMHKQRRGSNRHVQFGSFDDVKSKMASKAFGKLEYWSAVA